MLLVPAGGGGRGGGGEEGWGVGAVSAYCVLRTAYCVLLTVCCVLLTAHYLLLTAHQLGVQLAALAAATMHNPLPIPPLRALPVHLRLLPLTPQPSVVRREPRGCK